MRGLVIQLGAEFAGRNELRGNFPFACVCQNARVLDVAENDGDLRRDFAGGDGIGNGDKVGAFAGTEDTDAECVIHRDLNSGNVLIQLDGSGKYKKVLMRLKSFLFKHLFLM